MIYHSSKIKTKRKKNIIIYDQRKCGGKRYSKRQVMRKNNYEDVNETERSKKRRKSIKGQKKGKQDQ